MMWSRVVCGRLVGVAGVDRSPLLVILALALALALGFGVVVDGGVVRSG